MALIVKNMEYQRYMLNITLQDDNNIIPIHVNVKRGIKLTISEYGIQCLEEGLKRLNIVKTSIYTAYPDYMCQMWCNVQFNIILEFNKKNVFKRAYFNNEYLDIVNEQSVLIYKEIANYIRPNISDIVFDYLYFYLNK